MTNYNDGKWHGWNGGECPVHPETVIEIIYLDGDDVVREEALAKYCDFSVVAELPTIAFRVVKEHKEPREFWVWEDLNGCPHLGSYHVPGAFKVREVIE